MLKQIISIGLFVTLIGLSFQTAFAKPQPDWSKVASATSSEIAVKTSDGQTFFGKLTSATDTDIIIQLADKMELTNQSMTLKRTEVKKVWLAKLRFGKQRGLSTGIGAAVGAGLGLGLSFGLLAVYGADDAGDVIAGITAIGAGAGAGLGYLIGRKSHQKKQVIYEL